MTLLSTILIPTLGGAFAVAILGFTVGVFLGWILWRKNQAESRELLESLKTLKEEVTVLRKRDS